MADLFPRSLTAGLTFEQTVSVDTHRPPEWRLEAILRGPDAINLQADQEGGKHVFRVPAGRTREWLAGRYQYSLRATRTDGMVVELSGGGIQIKPDLSQLGSGHDARSHVERVLEAIKAVIEKRATLDQERYEINNRMLQRTPLADLLKLRSQYEAELKRLKAAERGSTYMQTIRVAFR